MARGVWGLDISKSSLKAVRLEFVKARVELTDVDTIEYTPAPTRDEITLEQEIRTALSTFAGRHRLKRDLIAASLPTHATFNRFIKLAPTSPERLKDILQFEAQQHIPFPINEVIWTHQAIDRVYEPGEEMDVVIFAIKREIVDQFLTLLAVSGIQVDIVQFAPVALYNYVMLDADLSEDKGGLGRNFIILDMGANNTDLLLVDGDKFWIRNLPVVGNEITKSIQQKFDIPFPEAEKLKLSVKEAQQAGKIFTTIQPVLKDLVNEIHRSIGYYKSLAPAGESPTFSKIVTLGKATRTIYFDDFISQRLSLEVVRLTKLNKVDIRSGVDQTLLRTQLPALGVAVGLALQGLNLAANRINLLPAELIKLKKAAARRPFIAATTAVLGLILIVFYLFARSAYQNLEAVYAETQVQIQAWREITQEYARAIHGLGDLKKDITRISKIVTDRNIWNKIFNALGSIPALQKHTLPEPKSYIEIGNDEDAARLKTFEQGKIWILDLSVSKEFASPEALEEGRPVRQPTGKKIEKSPATQEGKSLSQIRLSLICAIVYQAKADGSPDARASLNFVKEHLVTPLAKELNLTSPSDPVPLDSTPVPVLRTDDEGVSIEGEPKYSRFEVTLEIPLE